jgi:hypothetical protein
MDLILVVPAIFIMKCWDAATIFLDLKMSGWLALQLWHQDV